MEQGETENIEIPDQPKPGSTDPAKKTEPAKYIRRADWGAKPPKWIEALETPVKKVVLTWTETDPCITEDECKQRVREIQEEHMKDGDCPDIKHNFLVGGDGALYEGRGYTRMGPKYPKSEKTHEELYGKSIEIAFIQRHVIFLTPKITEPVKALLGIGVDSQYLDQDSDFVYFKDGKPIPKDPREQLNEVELKMD